MYNENNNEEIVNVEGIKKLNEVKVPKKKGNKRVVKTVGAVAGAVIIAFGGGMAGSYVLNMNNASNTSQVENTNNTPVNNAQSNVSNLSSTSGSLTIAQAIEKVKPAVVTISVSGTQNNYGYEQDYEGIGSGVIVSEEGYVVTNYHVINGSNKVTVKMSDGNEVDATVVNYDEKKDIAMLKLADGTKVPGVAELGDSDQLTAGEQVVAIGTPMSKEFEYSCTSGIVSAINRSVETSTGITMNLIQTDAAINPGNSGGPLINAKGQVVGINSMKLVKDEIEGMGFSIPINEVKDRMETLSKPMVSLGIQIVEITDELASQNDLPKGIYVKGVNDFSSAQKAGIKVGDIITEFDGKKIETSDELTEAKNAKSAGDEVSITVVRNDKEVELNITL